jgi:hypothetical protein
MTEDELQQEVILLAEKYQCRIFHSADSRRDIGRGFPDFVICGRHRVIFVELKSATGELKTEQVNWKYYLLAAGMIWMLWRPRDLANGHVEHVLQNL